jgi:signal peptidase I
MSIVPSSARSLPRSIIEGGVYLCLILLFSQTWFIDGLVAPCRVAGGSMATTLLGMHRNVVCADCGFAFACDAALRPISPRAVCPNCWYANNNIELLPDLDGDRVLIDRSAFNFRRPRRWEIVAFRYAQESEKIVIKRVAALPGESVQILNGDVYIEGQIQRKTLERQRAMAVMVYDAKYSPTITSIRPIPRPRWQGEKENSLWYSVGGGFTHPDSTKVFVKSPHPSPLPEGEGTQYRSLPDGKGTIDWLVYHHWRRMPGLQSDAQECPINDVMAYNQSLPRREEDIHAMNDLMLSFRLVKTSGRGLFFVRAVYGKDIYQVEIDPKIGSYRVNRNGCGIMREDNRITPQNKGLDVVISLIDRQLLLALNDQTVFCQPIDYPVLESESTLQPFAIGTQGLGIVVEDLRIYRDVYYTHPIGWNGRWALEKPVRLGENEYFVLGDNSPIAEDSRTWPDRSSVVDEMLIGKPLMIVFPAKSINLGPWHFQVPDPSRIGYIR